jgi:hypothetical protein
MQTSVPNYAKGCFIRKHITFANQQPDFASVAIMIQVNCLGGDMRIPGDLPNYSDKKAIDDFSVAELKKLGRQGGTVNKCLYENNISSWHWQPPLGYIDGNDFPEPGIMHRVGDSLYETAPSGAYIEDWVLHPGSDKGFAAFLWLCESASPETPTAAMIITGNCAMYIERRINENNHDAMSVQIESLANDRDAINQLMSCESSLAICDADGIYRKKYSNLPYQKGNVLNVPTLTAQLLEQGKISINNGNYWQVAEWCRFD